MPGPFTDKLRSMSAKMADSHGVLTDDEIDDTAATLMQAARAIELLEAELKDAKVVKR